MQLNLELGVVVALLPFTDIFKKRSSEVCEPLHGSPPHPRPRPPLPPLPPPPPPLPPPPPPPPPPPFPPPAP